MPLSRRAALSLLAARLSADPPAFKDRLQPAPINGGFQMEGYFVWCGSAIKGEDNRYHLFASRWRNDIPFMPHWVTNSEVVRASADSPTGPYKFEEVVLPARGPKFWDGRMSHNPTIHRWRGQYLLFYIGTNYQGPTPDPSHLLGGNHPARLEARANQRIGLATAPSVKGPWKRLDQPILQPRPGKWDALMTVNPAACVLDDGSVLLVYKSALDQKGLLTMGLARAKRFEGPYERVLDGPLFDFSATGDHVEDAYIWHDSSGYQLVMKDMKGGICGEAGGGIHATSPDGIKWRISTPPQAYSRHVRWSDGVTREQFRLERPQLLIEDGRPTHLFLATATGVDKVPNKTWNMVIPIK